MKNETLFNMALGLQIPWRFKDVTFSTDELAHNKLHQPIDFVLGSRFLDESNDFCRVHDTVERRR